jgi:NADH oxidase (H2O2-forming)
MQQRDVVIIGGGPAGRVIVHTLHSQNSAMSATLIKDEQINVNRCAVPYGIPLDKPIEKFQIPNKLVTDFGAEMVFDRVVKIDTKQKQVHTQNGQSFGYHIWYWPPDPGRWCRRYRGWSLPGSRRCAR